MPVLTQTTYHQSTTIIPSFPAAAAYVGPGDVVSGATAWYGLRAYSNATKGSNAIRIRRISDNSEQDFVTLSTGALDIASIATFLSATSGKIVSVYDQTGNGNTLTQATAGAQPSYVDSGIGSLPTASFALVGGGQFWASGSWNGTSTIGQPFTLTSVSNYAGNATDGFGALQFSTATIAIFWVDSPPTIGIYAPTPGLTASAALSTWEAFQGVGNGVSSDANLNGTANTGTTGSTAFGGATVQLGNGGGGRFVGSWVEGGMWNAGFTSGQSSSMSSNQHSYWGF